jgi:hypothetical protein
MRFLVIFIAVAFATAAFSATAKDTAKPVKSVTKQEVIKTPSVDTLRILHTDTLTILKHKEITVTKTWLDTCKLIGQTTDSSVFYDTTVFVKKVLKAAAVVQEKIKKTAKTTPTK